MKFRISVYLIILSFFAVIGIGSSSAVMAQAVELGDSVTATAKVVGIDRTDRTVALLGPQGNVVVLEVGQEARNFDQIQIGDMVKATYYESIALYVGSPTDKPDVNAGLVGARAMKGDKPAGIVVEAVDVSAKVTAIDKGKRSLTLELPDGRKVTTKVDPAVKAFDTLKVGDSIHARYTEAVAISVDKP